MLEVLVQPYVAAARARGLSLPLRALQARAAQRADAGADAWAPRSSSALLSGAVIAEKVFERPGIGTLFLEGFFARDIPRGAGRGAVRGHRLRAGQPAARPRLRAGRPAREAVVKRLLRAPFGLGSLLFFACALLGPWLAGRAATSSTSRTPYELPSRAHLARHRRQRHRPAERAAARRAAVGADLAERGGHLAVSGWAAGRAGRAARRPDSRWR